MLKSWGVSSARSTLTAWHQRQTVVLRKSFTNVRKARYDQPRFQMAQPSSGRATHASIRRSRRALPNVALLVETARSYGRNVLRGIGDYSRIHGRWVFHLTTDAPEQTAPPKTEWDGDGIIAQPHQDAKFIRELMERGVPVVSLSGPPGAGLPA